MFYTIRNNKHPHVFALTYFPVHPFILSLIHFATFTHEPVFAVPAVVGCRLIWGCFFLTLVCAYRRYSNISSSASMPHVSLPFAEKLNDLMAETSRKLHQNISIFPRLKSPPRGFEVKICAQDCPGPQHQSYKCNLPKHILMF